MLQGVFKRGRMSKWIYKSGNVEKEINGSKQMRRRMDSSWQEKSVQEEKRLRRGGDLKDRKGQRTITMATEARDILNSERIEEVNHIK